MAATGHEPVGSMGADEPLAVLSEQPQLLYWYFKQLFAQVTNPAIDSIREELVMSLMTFIGSPANILAEGPQQARLDQAEPPDPLQRGPGPHPRPQPPGLRLPHPAHRLSRRTETAPIWPRRWTSSAGRRRRRWPAANACSS